MKKTILAIFLVFIASSFVMAQTAPTDAGTPAGAGDKNMQNNDIKMRSVELDRIKRDADKIALVRREDGIEFNFSIIKNDFEGIQKEQDEIIKAYQQGDKINFAKINESAGKMTEMAIRLKANLFPPNANEKKSNKVKDSQETRSTDKDVKSVRNLIVDLDNMIGSFVTNMMFQNLQIIDPELSRKAGSDLDKIITSSGDLWLESKKIKSK